MTSKALSQGAFVIPKSLIIDADDEIPTSGRRIISLYDAVAGRISTAGFIPDHLVVSSTRDTASSSATSLAPEAVLFRTRNAPTRYEESDIYFSRKAAHIAELPESDLVKSLHCYASDFYSRTTPDAGIDDWKSLDETALIAFGVLIEEAALDILGETGDMTFTEGEQMSGSHSNANSSPVHRPAKKRRVNIG